MLIAVELSRGPSPVYIEVQTTNEKQARLAAYGYAYEGIISADPTDFEYPPTDELLDEYTSVVRPSATLALPS